MYMKFDSDVPLGRIFAMVTKWYLGVLTTKLEDLPIERHFFVLTVIADQNGAITQKALAEMVQKDKASMVRILDYLESHLMIERVSDPNDRRAYLIKTTKNAEPYIPRIKQAFAEVNAAALNGLDPKDFDHLLAIVQKMACNLSQLPANEIFLQFNKTKKTYTETEE